MKGFAYFLLLLTSACAQPKTLSSNLAQAYRTTSMRAESTVVGDFYRIREFHLALMQETNQPANAPYPSLDSLFLELKKNANEVVLWRLKYDTLYYHPSKEQGSNKRESNSRQEKKNISQKISIAEIKRNQSQDSTAYFQTKEAYTKLTTAYNIKRVGQEEYAALLNEKIVSWQDSLEELGRITAREKIDLYTRFPEKKGTTFFSAYQPISELEAYMKTFDSMLSQLQNSLSRFEEGNKEEYFYFGPYIRPRMELAATESLLGETAILMLDCRDKEKQYWQAYGKK